MSLLETPGRRIAALVAFANLFVCVVVAISLYSSYEFYRERAAVTSRNIARLTAESVAGDVHRIDLALQIVADQYEQLVASGRRDQISAFLVRQKARLPMVDGFRITDAEGNVLPYGEQPAPRVSLLDREYFTSLRTDPDLGLAIGQPLTSRLTGKWVLPFARAYKGPDGRFAGVITAPVTTDWFATRFSHLEIGPHGAVALRGDAGRAFAQLARFPNDAGFVGQTTVSARLRELFGRAPDAGTYEADSGPDRVRRTHSYQRLEDYPLITVVGLAREDWLGNWWREAGKLGALVLIFALLSGLGGWMVARAWRARMDAQFRLQFLAYHDVLTGLPNLALFRDRFEQARARAEREHSKLALLFIDLDQFKTINDSLGHEVGDSLLCQVGQRLRDCVSEGDTVSRRGGDEFLLLLTDLADTAATAVPLLAVLNRIAEPYQIVGSELSTSASIGIALYPDDGTDFDNLVKKADMAMYRAKEGGRNAYRFFDEQMNVDAVEQLSLRNGLRRALERHEFVLHYQPQIDIRTGEVVGAEALLRWAHPELGMIAPGRFIAVAEDSRLIVPIGAWVLMEACRQAMAWRRAGMPALTMAVNLSAVQFRRGDVEQTVLAALEASGLEAACLELEITESILIQNMEEVLDTVQQLKQLGIRLSIDDFGTGYSSLSYLKLLDVDKLKVDQSFVRDLMHAPNDAAIVEAIIQMGHSLGLRVIAEGVETEGALQRLSGLGCDEVQGFHFSKPMPADEFMRFVREHDPLAALSDARLGRGA